MKGLLFIFFAGVAAMFTASHAHAQISVPHAYAMAKCPSVGMTFSFDTSDPRHISAGRELIGLCLEIMADGQRVEPPMFIDVHPISGLFRKPNFKKVGPGAFEYTYKTHYNRVELPKDEVIGRVLRENIVLVKQ